MGVCDCQSPQRSQMSLRRPQKLSDVVSRCMVSFAYRVPVLRSAVGLLAAGAARELALADLAVLSRARLEEGSPEEASRLEMTAMMRKVRTEGASAASVRAECRRRH